MSTHEAMRERARAAALAGGAVVRNEIPGAVDRKARADYVTETDRAAERAVREALEGTGIPVVGEELGGEPAARYWLVDPLDGTTNFVHGFPVVAVSVALMDDGAPAAGCVHAPFLDATYTAARGGGAERDGEPLRVSGRAPAEAIVGTGFPFRHPDRLPEYLRVMLPALERFEDLRRPGAVAMDLAWVAEGVYDGFFELGLSAWDVAAGALLIEEAGGTITDWHGAGGYLAGDVLAGPPEVHAELLRIATGAGGEDDQTGS